VKGRDSIWTCRAGFEPDLAGELAEGRVIAPALVQGQRRPGAFPTFGRQGLIFAFEAPPTLESARALVPELFGAGDEPFALHVWVPDSDAANTKNGLAEAFGKKLRALFGARPSAERRADKLEPHERLVQVAILDETRAYFGASPVADVPSRFPGGRARMKLPPGAPSRATAKLLEAFTWIGVEPGPGEVAVDLGAAPGGWTFALLERRARVIAVDRAEMAPNLARHPRLEHVRDNAFAYRPDTPVDWLFCDMVHRPSEVAKLLARWGREGLAGLVLANLKLPMKKRLSEVASARRTLEAAGWKDVRTRQLYHDRDEITLFAHR